MKVNRSHRKFRNKKTDRLKILFIVIFFLFSFSFFLRWGAREGWGNYQFVLDEPEAQGGGGGGGG